MSSFFYRVFSKVEKNIWADELDSFMQKNDCSLDMIGVVEEDQENDPNAQPVCLLFVDDQDREVASLVYDRVADSDILRDEIEEFHGLVDEMGPACNREWVHEQLDKTVGCYAFEISEDAGFDADNWDEIATIAEWLRKQTEGFEQSDGGQITNENGVVILAVPDDGEDYDDEDEYEEKELDDSEDDEEEVEDEESDEDEEESDEDDEESDEEDEESDEDDEESDEEDEDYDDEDDEWENFPAAIRRDGAWVEREITSEEELEKFIQGEL